MLRTWIAATALSLAAGLAHAETEVVVQYPYAELFEGTHKRIIDKINAAVNATIKRPDIVKLWTEQGAVPMAMTPDEFDKFLRGDIVKWAEVVKKFADRPQ